MWNLLFAFGMVVGGAIAAIWLTPEESVQLSTSTINELEAYGIENPGAQIVPEELFGWDSLKSVTGVVMMILGGFFVGFGTRYAGGCTSGHAISGLSDLQLPSLIAVIGFFIGGLFVTYVVLPYILSI